MREALTLENSFLPAMRPIIALCLIFTIALHADAQEGPKHQISIYFGGGNYYISEDQQLELQEFIHKIPHVEQYSITIHSHTDNIGGVEFNNWLSQMRSNSAFEELLLNNIREEMIEIKDFGLHNPIYDNSTWEGRRKNRRVDIFLWPLAL